MTTSSTLWPKISIVMPSYNQGQYIEMAIRSLVSQEYPNLEFIIVDGGSTDDSVDVIKKHAAHLSHWVSEKDRGQSHAINKGLARCTGDIFNWTNSDDLLTPGALWTVAEAWQKNPGHIVSGHTEFFDGNGATGQSQAGGQTLKNFVRFWERENFGWSQPSTFLPLAAVQKAGGIREHLKYCMDYDLMVRLLADGTPVTYVDQVLARFRLHEASKTVGSKEAFRLERVPALRALKDLPVCVEPWEWDWQQSRRLVDVARHVWRHGARGRAMRLFGRALLTSPRGAWEEINSRFNRAKAEQQSWKGAS